MVRLQGLHQLQHPVGRNVAKTRTPSVSQWVSSEDDVIRLRPMPNRNRITKEPPVKSGGEGWLVNAAQQLLVQFKPDTPSAQEQWVSVRTYGWKPPHPPEPQSRRRMLRPNAIEAWETMLKTGWRRCSPPVH